MLSIYNGTRSGQDAQLADGHARRCDLPSARIVLVLEARSDRAVEAEVGEMRMSNRFRLLAFGFVAAFVLGTPVHAQDDPAAPADRPAQEVQTQRRDRARVHQPGQSSDVRRRAEIRGRVDGTTRGARNRSQAARDRAGANRGVGATRGVRGNRGDRGSQVRDRATGSRARDAVRRRDRVHRPAN